MEKNKTITVKEFAKIHKIPRTTATLWCRNGTLPGAFQETTPFGDVWYIPVETSDNFKKPKRGRPSKKSNEISAV